MRKKQPKYIRDLFEEKFTEKFVAYIEKNNFTYLKDIFKTSRIKILKDLIEKNIHFKTDIYLSNFDPDTNKVFTLQDFHSQISNIQYRFYLYKLLYFKYIFDLTQKTECIYNLKKIISNTTQKKLNKSLKNFQEKNKNFYLFEHISNNTTINIVLTKILNEIEKEITKNINPELNELLKTQLTIPLKSYKKAHLNPNIEQRPGLLKKEYDNISRCIELYNEFANDKVLLNEDNIRYYLSFKRDLEINDKEIEFIINNCFNTQKNKKDLAFQYLKETFGLSKNDEALDKLLDRERNKLKQKEQEEAKENIIISFKELDDEIIKLNLYDKTTAPERIDTSKRLINYKFKNIK